MGALELDPKMTEFFENQKETFETKTSKLGKVQKLLAGEDDNKDSVDVSDHEFSKGLAFLHTYCQIVEKVHPNEKMPNWWQNMKHQVATVI